MTIGYWVDNGVVIDPNGTHFSYYVIAYTSRSPDSNPSSLVHIWGNPCKALPEAIEKAFVEPDMDQTPRNMNISTFPNPFNFSTTIYFELPQASDVRLELYNLLGERIRTLWIGNRAAGVYELTWDGKDGAGRSLPSGVYLCVLTTAGQRAVRKLVLAQ